MLKRILVGDFKRSIGISITLTVLIALAAALIVMSASLTAQTMSAVDALWRKSSPPDVVQMHTGEIDAQAVDSWVSDRAEVEDYHLLRTLPLPGSQLWLAGKNQADSVLEPAFVLSPERFDVLLDEHGERVNPAQGEIAMPVHYLAIGELKLGDTVKIKIDDFEREFTVTSFVRDVQMNPSMVTSKRMVVNPADFEAINAHLEPEYIIEFKLAPGANTQEFLDAYSAADMPKRGISVDASIFRLMNGFTTLLVVVLALIIAAFLVCISALALRFAFLTAMENDMAEIGTLKAIGASNRDLKRLYLVKYAALAIVGTVVGAVVAIPMTNAAMKLVLVYLGEVHHSAWTILPPIIAALIVPATIVLFCWVLLRRLTTVSATEVLRQGGASNQHRVRWMKLSRSTFLPVHQWIGCSEALRPANLLLVGVMVVSAFLMILPSAVVSTIEDPRFATYLGIGNTDIRVDVREGGVDVKTIERALAGNSDISKSVTLVSNRYDIEGSDGWDQIVVERGDHSVFPLTYQEGTAPSQDDEIALSTNQAKQLNAAVGDTVKLRASDEVLQLRVTGTYQDITNGGLTAKATFDDATPVVWQVMYLDVGDEAKIDAIVKELAAEFPTAKVSSIRDFSRQTLGATSAQLQVVAVLAACVAAGLVFLVTTLFLILVINQERQEIRTLRAIGATHRGLVLQYLTRFGVIGVVGTVLGTIAVPFIGGGALRGVLGLLGAPGVQLLPNPLVSWVLMPLILVCVVLVAAAAATRMIRKV